MTMTVGGLVKPLSRRGAHAARRPIPYIKPNQDGALCGDRRNDSPFISSFDEDKKRKYRQQIKERTKKWIVWGSLALVLVALLKSQSSTSDESALRGGAETGTKSEANIVSPKTAPPAAVKPPAAEAALGDPSVVKGMMMAIEKGLKDEICGSEISINLSDKTSWPYTPLLGNGKVPSDAIAKEVVLLKRDTPFGSTGEQLNSFFHAYDLAYHRGRPLYITEDSWVWDTLFTLFFGREFFGIGTGNHSKKKVLYHLEKILRVKIVESEGVLHSLGIQDPEYMPTNGLFYYVGKTDLNPAQIRNHRETILRQLFQYPAEGACSTIETLLAAQKDDKYTALHLASSKNMYLSKLSEATGKDHTAAAEMQPDYVLNILKRENMLKHSIFPIFFDGDTEADKEALSRLSKNPELASLIRHDNKASHLVGNVYLAVLADFYLGNPTDHLSLWITRMRMALGIGGTYILTEKRGDNWVSYMDDVNHLDLYDAQKLRPWTG